jgi:sRNA-binding regulator protein Hfq
MITFYKEIQDRILTNDQKKKTLVTIFLVNQHHLEIQIKKKKLKLKKFLLIPT